jgi:hypothetical protein
MLAAVVAIAVLTVLVQAWHAPSGGAGGSNPFGLQRSSTPQGPVLITAVSTGLIWSLGAVPPTTVTVRDDSTRAADCEVWWILSRRGDPTPWQDPIQRSVPIAVTATPLRSEAVGLDRLGAASPKPGIFSLSVWVHCRNPSSGAWVPSDGATMGGAVEVLAASPLLARSSDDSRLFWIDAASAARLIVGRPGRIRVTIANAWVEPVMVDVSASLAPAGSGQAGAGNSGAGATARSEPTYVNLSAVGLSSVDLTVPRLPGPGSYRLTIEAQLIQATTSVTVDTVHVEPEVVVSA